MAYPETPGFQAHSETSRKAAERLISADSMERDIFEVLDSYESGWTGDELTTHLMERGHPDVQTGTVAARLAGLEEKGKAVLSTLERRTRAKRPAGVWFSPRMAKKVGVELQKRTKKPKVSDLLRRIATLELENEQLKRGNHETETDLPKSHYDNS